MLSYIIILILAPLVTFLFLDSQINACPVFSLTAKIFCMLSVYTLFSVSREHMLKITCTWQLFLSLLELLVKLLYMKIFRRFVMPRRCNYFWSDSLPQFRLHHSSDIFIIWSLGCIDCDIDLLFRCNYRFLVFLINPLQLAVTTALWWLFVNVKCSSGFLRRSMWGVGVVWGDYSMRRAITVWAASLTLGCATATVFVLQFIAGLYHILKHLLLLFDASYLLVAFFDQELLLSVWVNNLSQDQVDGEEGAKDYQQAKEDVGGERIVTRVDIVVHHISPAL